MKKHALTLAVSLALPAAAFAVEPIAYGNYTPNADGTLNAGCDATATCSTSPISDVGFMQREVTKDGITYFQTIIVDSAAGEDFSTESFVRTGASNGGIAARQSLSATNAADGTLTSTTDLNIGSFNVGGEDKVNLTQNVTDAPSGATFRAGFQFDKAADDTTVTTLTQDVVSIGPAGSTEDFSDSFKFIQNKDAAGAVSGASLDIVSGVMLNNSPDQNLQDQTFGYASRTGSFTTASSAALTSDTATPVVDWAANDTIERVLVGQTVVGAGQFGYDRITNVDGATALSESTVFDLASAVPAHTVNGGSDPFAAGSNITLISSPLP